MASIYRMEMENGVPKVIDLSRVRAVPRHLPRRSFRQPDRLTSSPDKCHAASVTTATVLVYFPAASFLHAVRNLQGEQNAAKPVCPRLNGRADVSSCPRSNGAIDSGSRT